MSIYRNSAFKNACIKMPIHPASRRPAPHFERPAIVVQPPCEPSPSASLERQPSQQSVANRKHNQTNTKNVESLVDFIESIPDYKDVNHLSKQEFYGKLDLLKKKQAELNSACFMTENYRTCVDAEAASINGCQRSFNDVRLHRKVGNRSKSASPFRSTPLLTIPEPFHMTQREEEETMREETVMACKSFSETENTNAKQHRPLKPSAIPVTSRYPMYKEVLATQARRSQLAKLNSAIELQAQMKPFTFSSDKTASEPHTCSPNATGDEQHTSPQEDDAHKPVADHCFRAKPCPKNLFSNYFYHKMWEDEYFRALNRKLRAEQLLKMSSLPPSMQRRENNADSDVRTCSSSVTAVPTAERTTKSERSCSAQSSKRAGRRRNKRVKKKTDYCHLTTKVEKARDFITTSPQPFEFETAKRSVSRKSQKPCSTASTVGSSKATNSTNPSPQPMYPVARPNLAANLRLEWAQQKLCKLSFGPDKTFPNEKMKRPNWGVRKSPAWKSLYYDNTNDEDISLRLATRRAEQKLRHEEHSINMELMRQRVRAAPLLLEGPTQWATSMDDLRHNCTRDDEQRRQLDYEKQQSSRRKQRSSRNPSKLSNYSDGRYSGKSVGSSCLNIDDCEFENPEKHIV